MPIVSGLLSACNVSSDSDISESDSIGDSLNNCWWLAVLGSSTITSVL